jgi:hypothetical protein
MGPRAEEVVKKQTISRKDAKAQRLAKNNCFVFFAPLATLRLCVKRFCSSRDYFTASVAVGHNLSAVTGLNWPQSRMFSGGRFATPPYGKCSTPLRGLGQHHSQPDHPWSLS